MKKVTHSRLIKPTKKQLVLGLLATGGLVLLVVVLELTNTTHFFHNRQAVSSPIPATSPTSINQPTSPNTSTNTNSQNNSKVTTPTTTSPNSDKTVASGTTQTGAAPIAPFGTFVSNHHPSSKNSAEQSACTTTPGATCTITLVNSDNVTKTLEAKTADANGSVIWNWDIKTAGVTTGTWKITATSSLNGQTKSATDAQNLEVQQ